MDGVNGRVYGVRAIERRQLRTARRGAVGRVKVLQGALGRVVNEACCDKLPYMSEAPPPTVLDGHTPTLVVVAKGSEIKYMRLKKMVPSGKRRVLYIDICHSGRVDLWVLRRVDARSAWGAVARRDEFDDGTFDSAKIRRLPQWSIVCNPCCCEFRPATKQTGHGRTLLPYFCFPYP